QATRISTARYFSTSDPNDAAAARNELARLKEILAAMPPLTGNKRLLKFLAALEPGVAAFAKGLGEAVDGNQALLTAQGETRAALDRL
ncbi:hypothetical protein ABTK13_21440, partial [Acinetobacter baumannii]